METTYYAMNPWWERKEVDSGIDRLDYLERLPALIGRKQIEVIVGGRRMGKTTLIRQFIKRLIQQGVEAKDILYLALDNPALSATPLSEHLKNIRKMHLHDRGRKLFLFLDEVQESVNWEAELKSLYDMESRKRMALGYFAESEKEVDFVVGEAKRFIPAEVKFISSLDWTEKKFSGIKLFLRRFPEAQEVLLITRSVEAELKVGQSIVRAIPLWRFLLSSASYLGTLQL